ncbi:hypothetical protein D4765_17250 [Subtercola vilae]|uniref:DoxX family membrane protein n=1 Tax=Subtercola vilae TaxID=2056433 RepID=A0A4T2BG40_9MICO|nr:hypothetical protein [Subtercola vilae]MEA9986959.1 hypothetical protein [Subtercola sp. RTI3]TIH30275.1 hypothetical protein D4765_17250 [Subtercola vilae]
MSKNTRCLNTVSLLATLLLGAGVVHLVRPRVFDPVVPPQLPGSARTWVYLSGVAELTAGVALSIPRTRRLGGALAAALFVAVFPGNLQMARDARTPARRAITLARLPLQLPLVVSALRIARR